MFRFGPFTLDPERGELTQDGRPVRLQPQPMKLLALLVGRGGRIVTREEIQEALWNGETFVDYDQSINFCVKQVREVLGDDAGRPRFIETVPRRGYRFIGVSVTSAAQETKGAVDPSSGTRWLGVAAGLAAASSLAVWLGFRPSTSGSTDFVARPITGRSGLEWMPSASPDGNLLAYAAAGADGHDIFVVPMRGGDPVRVTDRPGDDLMPRWSPDGSLLAFVSALGEEVSIYLTPALGGAPRRIAETGLSQDRQFNLVSKSLGSRPWSKDGATLLFSRATERGGAAIWSVDVSTGRQEPVTDPPPAVIDRDATWTFEGDRIAFTRRGPSSTGIWSFRWDEKEPEELVVDEHQNAQPAWLPGGRALVFASTRANARHLWRLDLDSRQIRRITAGSVPHEHPSVLGDGSILYNELDLRPNLFSLELESGRMEQVTYNSRTNFSPRWSPDGARLVYASTRTGSSEIWLFDTASGSERRLTEVSGWTPDWSPDGREVVFTSERDGGRRLWIADVESGRLRRLTEETVRLTSYLRYHPRWSPDGKAVAYLSPEGALRAVDPVSTETREVLPSASLFDWYLDSGRVIYTTPGEGQVTEVLARDLTTGREIELDSGYVTDLSVARDGSAVLFCRGKGHNYQEVYLLPLTSPGDDGLRRRAGEPRRLTFGSGQWHAHNPSLHPNGETVIFAREPVEGDVYLLEPADSAS